MNTEEGERMDRQNQIIIDMNTIMEAINSFREAKTPDSVIISRIYHLCKFEREQAERKIDEALDAMESDFIESLKKQTRN
jgi:uncharacterized protein YpiB (UPF0302 family)